MNGVTMSSRDRRAVGLGVALLTPVLLWRLFISPYAAENTRLRAEFQVQSDLLLRELSVVAEARADAEAMAGLVELLERHGPRLLDREAGAHELSSYVQRLAGDAPIHFETIEPWASDGTDGVLTPVSVEVRAESDLEGFLTLINDLETGPKLVLLDSLNVSRGGLSGLEEPERLSFRFLVTGLTVPVSARASGLATTGHVAGS